MYKFSSLLLSIFIVTFCWGQKHSGDPYSFTLNGNKITPPSDFNSSLKSLKLDFSEQKGPKTVILQFNSIPNIKQQQKLKEEGVVLMDYLQGNAYYASVTKGFSNIKARNAKNIRSLIPILPIYKIEQRIARGDIPDYAKTKPGMISVVISYFDLSDEVQMLHDLKELRSSSIRMVRIFHNISAEISQPEIERLASCSWVKNICLVDPPQKTDNMNAGHTHRANVLASNIRGLGYGLSGKGIKIGLWDLDVEHHPDFDDRITVREFEMHSHDHGTHVCGTLAGAGIIDPAGKGMASEATVYAWNFNQQSNGLTVPEERLISLDKDGIELTSNSYGPNYEACPNPFSYNNTDKNEDYICNLYPYFLFVYAAGNAQTNCPDGFKTTVKNMKNSLHVANVDNKEDLSSTSSIGPSYDGRLIPNISGVGDWVYSCMFDNSYGYMGGTSMATPGVAGTMALVVERYKQTHGGNLPISSFMRALACNTATDRGNPGPDFKFGYGVINGRRAVEVMEENTYFTDTITHGASRTKQIEIPEGVAELKVMLSWTDPSGNPDLEKILVNDLDLKVISEDSTILPWVLDPENPAADAARGIDQLNNLEQVCITNPKAGPYTIQVSGTTIPAGIQEYSVVYNVVMPSLKITYPLDGDVLVPNSEAIICWDCEGYSRPLTIEYSGNNGLTYEQIAVNLSSKNRSFIWKVPADSVVAHAKFRISSGSAFDETKGSFSIIATPLNLKMSQAQCGGLGTFTLSWDSVQNAKYEILKLKDQQYEHYGESSVTHFEIRDLSPGLKHYFCVKAIDLLTGTVSERSIAVEATLSEEMVKLPFNEDFENQQAPNFILNSTEAYGTVAVRFVNNDQKYGIRFEGASTSDDWVDASGEECFLKNPNYVVRASLCHIDASSFENDNLRLSFDFRQKYLENPGTSYFRVMVNGEYRSDSNGNQIFGDTLQENYETLYFDLSDMAGKAPFSVVFESVCKSKYNVGREATGDYIFYNNTSDGGDFIAIDNVKIYKPDDDYQLKTLSYGEGHTQSEPITLGIRNLSSAAGFDVPVYYQINGGDRVVENTDTITPLAVLNYTFNQKANLSVEGKYVIVAGVLAKNDSITQNNELSTSFTIDTLSVRMGSGLDTVYTCDARFTDNGGLFENYRANQWASLTFIPEDENKTMAVDFEEFNIEKEFDYLYIYNGSDMLAPLLAKITGNELPQSFISTALGGELTFKFVSDRGAEESGWVARIHCVDRDSVDLTLREITKPSPPEGIKTDQEEIAFVVVNSGTENIERYKAYYQIDSLPLIMQEFDTQLHVGEMEEQSFSVLADLSSPGSYRLKVWIETSDDRSKYNDTLSTEIVSFSNLPDAGVLQIETVLPARENLSTIAAMIMNYGYVPLHNFDVVYRINGGAEVKQTFSDTINAGETKQFEFSEKVNLTAANTSWQIEVFVIVPNDVNLENNTKQTEVITPPDHNTNMLANFTGGANVVSAGNAGKIDLVNDYTIECWVKLSDPVSFGHIFNKTNVSLWYQYNSGSFYYGENSFILDVSTESGGFRWYVPNSYKSGVWQHLALTVSPGNDYVLYIDGVAQQWKVYSGKAEATKSNVEYPICIGNRPSDLKRSAMGQIDEFRVWNKCLDETTIRENSMTDYAPNTPRLIAYYKFIEGLGKYVYDYSINDNTAVVSNADVTVPGKDFFWNIPGSFFSNFSISSEKLPATFNAETQTYMVTMDNADLTALTASFDILQHAVVTVDDSVQQSGVTANDFSKGQLEYVVSGVGFNEGIHQTFKVEVSNDLNSDCELETFSFELSENPNLFAPISLMKNGEHFIQKVNRMLDLTALKASFTVSSGATVLMNDTEQSSPQSLATDYSKPLLLTVISGNKRRFKNYTIFVDAKNDQSELISFSIVEEQVGQSQIDTLNNIIRIWTKNNSNLSALTSQFEISENATMYVKSIRQRNGVTVNDFTSPLIYSVVSEDEINATDWNIEVAIDDVNPVITLIGDSVVTLVKGGVFTDPGATAYDNVDGDISMNISKTGSVNTEVLGSYILNYTVKDEAGNRDSTTRIALVVNRTNIENASLPGIDVYSKDKTLYVKMPEQIDGASLTIFNVIGSRVKECPNLHSGLNFIPTELLSGIYLIAIKKDDLIFSGKVVIK
jgi:hypothetical protein